MKYSVLIVDDNLTNLKLAASVLSPHYKLFIADDGEKAIKIAETKAPDLILLDVMMPGISGYEVCKLLKQSEVTKEIPVIFLTAKTDESDIEMAFEVGGVDYVTNPFKVKEILSRVKTQIDLKEAREALKDQIVNRDNFFSIIAHDLRSPFNGFLNMTELLAEGIEEFSKEELSEISKEMYKTSLNLFKLIENLLDWARMQKGQIEYKPKEINICDLVNESLSAINQRAAQKGITISNEVAEDLKINADEKMISTVLRNLISNAVKFTRRDGEVTIASDLSDSKEVIISVKDNGVGISVNDINKLFRMEEKVKSIGTDGEPSTGLGLLLCKEFIEKHCGRIWVESEEGKGSTFYFSIPKAI